MTGSAGATPQESALQHSPPVKVYIAVSLLAGCTLELTFQSFVMFDEQLDVRTLLTHPT